MLLRKSIPIPKMKNNINIRQDQKITDLYHLNLKGVSFTMSKHELEFLQGLLTVMLKRKKFRPKFNI